MKSSGRWLLVGITVLAILCTHITAGNNADSTMPAPVLANLTQQRVSAVSQRQLEVLSGQTWVAVSFHRNYTSQITNQSAFDTLLVGFGVYQGAYPGLLVYRYKNQAISPGVSNTTAVNASTFTVSLRKFFAALIVYNETNNVPGFQYPNGDAIVKKISLQETLSLKYSHITTQSFTTTADDSTTVTVYSATICRSDQSFCLEGSYCASTVSSLGIQADHIKFGIKIDVSKLGITFAPNQYVALATVLAWDSQTKDEGLNDSDVHQNTTHDLTISSGHADNATVDYDKFVGVNFTNGSFTVAPMITGSVALFSTEIDGDVFEASKRRLLFHSINLPASGVGLVSWDPVLGADANDMAVQPVPSSASPLYSFGLSTLATTFCVLLAIFM